jgi:CHAT domain-containing protein/tetratricopeptide (TPR) repeat protein
MGKNLIYKLLTFVIILILSQAEVFSLEWKQLNDSTNYYLAQQDYRSAKVWAEKALTQVEKEFGKNDTNYIFTIEKLYDINFNLRDFETALVNSIEDSSLTHSLFQEQSINHAKALYRLGNVYSALRKYQDAEPLLLKSLQIRRQLIKGDDSLLAYCMNKTAEFLDDINKTGEAEKLNKEALDMRLRLFRDNHPDIADSYVNEAYYLKKQGKYDEAEPYYKEALRIYRKINHPDLPLCITNLAVLYESMGRYQEAEKLYKEALEIRRKTYTSFHPALAASINNMARIYRILGKYQQAETLFKEALDMYGKLVRGDHPVLAQLLTNIAELYSTLGRFPDAEPYYLKSLEMYRRLYKQDNPALSNSLNNVASFYLNIGHYDEAEPLFKDALDMNRRLYKGGHVLLATTIINLALCEQNEGKFSEAEPLYREALEMARKLYSKDSPDLVYFITNTASFYKLRGNTKKAEILYQEALDIARRIYKEDHPDLALSINNMAFFYLDAGELIKAEPLYLEAYEMMKRIYKGDHPNVASALNNLASFYETSGLNNKAEKFYMEALEMRKRIFKTDNPYVALSLNNLASFYLSEGKYDEAEPLMKEALSINRKIYKTETPTLVNNIIGLAMLYEDRESYAQAEPLYNEAFVDIQKIVNSYFPSLSEKEKGQFWSTMKGYYDSFNSFAIKRMKDNPAIIGDMYDNQLVTKALLFSSISKVKRRILNSRDTTLIDNYKSWVALKEYLVKLYTYTKVQLVKENVNLDSIENVANLLEKQISLKSELFSESYEKKKISWRTIQAFLKPDEAAVEIIRFRYRDKKLTDKIIYAALIVTDQTTEHPQIVLMDNGDKLEGWLYKIYRENLKSDQPDKESFNVYWSKIYDLLKSIKKVYLSTDGIYNKINPATFYAPDDKYLLEEQDIQICNSTKDIIVNYYKIQKESNLLNSAELFGNPSFNLSPEKKKELESQRERKPSPAYPFMDADSVSGFRLENLPGTENEILNIGKYLQSKNWLVNVHLREDALKSAVQTVSNPRVLHIATHGIFLPDINTANGNIFGFENKRLLENPLLRSGLFFAGAADYINDSISRISEENNGILTAYEAMDLDLDHTELIVLSACETGLGEIKNGEGVYGLQRAFQTAGAKTVLMSLWNVGDESTNQLMSSFYDNWVSGMTKREAFHQAQLGIYHKYKIPYIWGAFVMVGE